MASSTTAPQLFESLTRREKLAIAANDRRVITQTFGYECQWYDAVVINATIELCHRYAQSHPNRK